MGFHNGSKIHREGRVAVSIGMYLLLILGIGGCTTESLPSTQEITPPVKAAWAKEKPSLVPRELLTASLVGKGTPTAVTVKQVSLNRSRAGRFVQSPAIQDTYGPSMAYLPVADTPPPTVSGMKFGPCITYWPVTTRIEAA